MKNNIPAFPVHPELNRFEPHAGMTLRDYFAAKVMEAMLGPAWNLKDADIPARAYKMADLMMEARKQ